MHFTASTAQAMKDKVAEGKGATAVTSPISAPEANELKILESVFEEYGRRGKGDPPLHP
jgi:phosphoribulokinase